jgi:hypothetical protein
MGIVLDGVLLPGSVVAVWSNCRFAGATVLRVAHAYERAVGGFATPPVTTAG